MVENVEDLDFRLLMLREISSLGISTRAINSLINSGILYVGDLIGKTEMGLLRIPEFGRKSLNEVKAALSGLGLQLCTDVSGWPEPSVHN